MNKLKVYEQILSKLEEGVHVVNKEGRTVIYNKAMAEIEGMKAEDVIEENLLQVLPALGYESTHMEVLKKGKAIRAKYQEYISKQGKKIVAVNSTYPIMEKGQVVGSFEISKDITYMRKMSEKMLELYSEVADSKKGSFSFPDILGTSKEIKDIIEQCRQVAVTSSNVFIVGDSGTGKEMFAQSIHNASPRRDKPMVAENCAAIPENLLESILFGTTKGSFTGAENKEGLLKQVDGGTLILDEINSMPMSLQSKILRVLETKRYRPIGSNIENQVDVRIIAITNKDPIELVREGKMREDLFYRLSVINIRIPNLQERKGDIEFFTDYYIKYYEEVLNKRLKGVSNEVLRFFKKYDWPGNIRELKHIIEGAMSMMKDGETLQLKHMPYYIRSMLNLRTGQSNSIFTEDNTEKIINQKKSLEEVLNEIEKDIIIKLFHDNNNNISKTAEILGIKRQGLQYKLKKYKIGI